MRKIALLGSTGSIGTQALDIIRAHSDLFEAYFLTANDNADLLIRQAREFVPDSVVIANADKYDYVSESLADLPIKVYAGADAICDVVTASPIDIVLTAMVGFSGLRPTVAALKAGKAIALANKETLVVAGEIITRLALENKCPLLPVDSEHSAIFQCLTGSGDNPVEALLLTASGGPFRQMDAAALARVTAAQALKHPNWVMGAKITIDSASMMNKGFSYTEAKAAYQTLDIKEDEETQQKLLYKELDKQYRKYSKKYDEYELKQRLTQALARKGYDFSDIASALREYL